MMFSRLFASVLLAGLAVSSVTAQEVSQAELDGFLTQVKSCWTLAPDDVASGRKATVRLDLGITGEIENLEVISSDTSVAGRRIAEGAVRALQRCAPYSFSAESYESWKTLEIDLQP